MSLVHTGGYFFLAQVLLLDEFEDRICKPSIYRPNLVLGVTFFPDQKVSHYPFLLSRLAHGVDTMEHSTSAPSERCSRLQVVVMGGSWERKPALGRLGAPGILGHVVTPGEVGVDQVKSQVWQEDSSC